MRWVELIVFVFAVTALASGCVNDSDWRDDEDGDDDVADAGDTDSEDSDSDSAALTSGVRGYTLVIGAEFDGVHVDASEFGTGFGAGSVISDENGYYEMELSPGVYSISAFYVVAASYDCAGGLIPVVVSTGLWVDLDVDLYCSDLDP